MNDTQPLTLVMLLRRIEALEQEVADLKAQPPRVPLSEVRFGPSPFEFQETVYRPPTRIVPAEDLPPLFTIIRTGDAPFPPPVTSDDSGNVRRSLTAAYQPDWSKIAMTHLGDVRPNQEPSDP